jgi:amino acid permease
MASEPIRIELRGLSAEVEEAQRDLQQTLEALEDKLLPQRAARRLVTRHDPMLVLVGAAATGLALGLIRDESPTARTGALIAALAAGAVVFRLMRSRE